MDQQTETFAGPGYCQDCEHDLRGVQNHRCPECGRLFDPENKKTFLRYQPTWAGRLFGGLAIIKEPFPEMEGMSKANKNKVYRDSKFMRLWVIMFFGPATLLILTYVAEIAATMFLSDWKLAINVTVATTSGMVLIAVYFTWRAARKHLYALMKELDIRPGRCQHCQYDLTNEPEDDCPNCHKPVL